MGEEAVISLRSDERERRLTPRAASGWWTLAAGIAILAAAGWVRAASVLYLAVALLATIAAAVLIARGRHPRPRWAMLATLLLALFAVLALLAQLRLARIDRDWSTERARIAARGAASLQSALASTAAALRRSATDALRAPTAPDAAFASVAGLTGGPEERGLVLYRDGVPVAWAGTTRIATDSVPPGLGVAMTPFYVVLTYAATHGSARAVATAIVHAEPPADRLAVALDRLVARHADVRGFALAPPGADTSAGAVAFAPAGRPLLTARVLPLVRAGVRLRTRERAELRGAIVLALVLVTFLVATWRAARAATWRLGALAVAVACVGLVPLNDFSNHTRLFDPALYYAGFGGRLTSSAGALGLTAALVLLGVLALLRARVRSRWLAALGVLAIAGLGPFLLRDLARGIFPPAPGVSIALWLYWELPLFLASVSILLAGAAAGSAALPAGRGVPPLVAPLLATIAALLGPVVWIAPGSWPWWYPALWIAAIGALALTRRHRRLVLAASIVAALGATTLVWGATSRRRVELAARDVAGLTTVDAYALELLHRFGDQLASGPPPRSRADLLERYVTSDLAAAEYPVWLVSWGRAGEPLADLHTADFPVRGELVANAVTAARGADSAEVRSLPAASGLQLVLAVPYATGEVTTVVLAPRSELFPSDPFAALIGLTQRHGAEPPYTVSVSPADSQALAADLRPRWRRSDTGVYGEWIVRAPAGAQRAHVEVELRPLDVLIERGALLLLLDLACVGVLWLLSAVADGGFGRWWRSRRRRWANSYRARLSLALFLFFVVPAAGLSVWSYRQLLSDDRQSRELLVQETLRTAATSGDVTHLEEAGDRLDTPLLLYRAGELRQASDTLYDLLAPLGRFLPPAVALQTGPDEALVASHARRVDGVTALLGYRSTIGPDGDRVVLAAPARMTDVALDRRRRDLAILLLFATALGAVAALWLSEVAGREFSRPIGALRGAALAIAAGDREPPLDLEPPSEFRPVFAAFRRMAADLDESRGALEEARRRLAAVLRNVASGVLAITRDGRILLANPQAEEIVGRPLAAGEPLAATVPESLAAPVAGFVAGDAEEEAVETTLGGRQLRVHLTRLTRGDGGVVVTLDDVTELARAQRVLAWGEMARQVAHEIKNPLTPIRLGVQHLRRAHRDARADFADILERNVERILAEIDRLDEIARAFSRYGTAPAERTAAEPTDVAAVVRDVVALERMGEGGVQWEVRGADRPAVALARGDELREVLLNVLENARLAHARHVAVDVAREDGRVLLAVRDDGEGIPDDVLPRIFEPHFSTRTSGSGLGLAVSRRLIDAWGGEISVTSARGEGTRVEIALPRA